MACFPVSREVMKGNKLQLKHADQDKAAVVDALKESTNGTTVRSSKRSTCTGTANSRPNSSGPSTPRSPQLPRRPLLLRRPRLIQLFCYMSLPLLRPRPLPLHLSGLHLPLLLQADARPSPPASHANHLARPPVHFQRPVPHAVVVTDAAKSPCAEKCHPLPVVKYQHKTNSRP